MNQSMQHDADLGKVGTPTLNNILDAFVSPGTKYLKDVEIQITEWHNRQLAVVLKEMIKLKQTHECDYDKDSSTVFSLDYLPVSVLEAKLKEVEKS